MGIHYDYKSTRGEKAMKKEAKRKARLEERKQKECKRKKPRLMKDKMHDIQKPITLDDLTNPDKKLIFMKDYQRKEASLLRKDLALKKNLRKRKKFKQKYKIQKEKINECFVR